MGFILRVTRAIGLLSIYMCIQHIGTVDPLSCVPAEAEGGMMAGAADADQVPSTGIKSAYKNVL